MFTKPGCLILLNGPSSAGKSTLCKLVRERIDAPFLHFSFDLFISDADILPKRREPKYGITWNDMRAQVLEGFYRCLGALLSAGNNLVVDTIIENEEQKHRLISVLKEFDVFFVGVHCPPEELERRERARGNRPIGDAVRDLETVHTFLPYDLEIDSSDESERVVELIVRAWENRYQSAPILGKARSP